jgi:hypothetical protein
MRKLKLLAHDSLDDNLFLDGSTGYFMSEDRTDKKLQIYRLSPDFLSVSALVASGLATADPTSTGHGHRRTVARRLTMPTARPSCQFRRWYSGRADAAGMIRLWRIGSSHS